MVEGAVYSEMCLFCRCRGPDGNHFNCNRYRKCNQCKNDWISGNSKLACETCFEGWLLGPGDCTKGKWAFAITICRDELHRIS